MARSGVALTGDWAWSHLRGAIESVAPSHGDWTVNQSTSALPALLGSPPPIVLQGEPSLLAPPLEPSPSCDVPPDEPTHHVALASQGPQLRQRRGRHDFTPFSEQLSVIFPRVALLLWFPEIRSPLDPLSWWYDASAYC